jgi:hypothetical protein
VLVILTVPLSREGSCVSDIDCATVKRGFAC